MTVTVEKKVQKKKQKKKIVYRKQLFIHLSEHREYTFEEASTVCWSVNIRGEKKNKKKKNHFFSHATGRDREDALDIDKCLQSK